MQITRLDVINTIYTLTVSILAILLPLYLIDQNVSLNDIGIILSLSPLIFLIFRVLFASIADTIGTRKISLFYSCMSLLSIAIYSFSTAPLFFGLGTVVEGLRASGFWSVIRTESISESKSKNKSSILIHYANLRAIVEGLGRLFGGFIIAFFGFSNTFVFLAFLSVLIFFLNFSNNHQNHQSLLKTPFHKKIFEKRSNHFWNLSFLQILVWLPFNLLAGFALPLYLKLELNYSIEQTGFFVAFFLTFIGFVSIFSRKFNLTLHTLYQLSFLVAIGFLLFFFSNSNPILPILVIGFGLGASNVLAEHLLSENMRNSSEISTDVALTFAPLKLVEFVIIFFSGFMISSFGFSPIFLICIASILLFLYFSKKHLINSNTHI